MAYSQQVLFVFSVNSIHGRFFNEHDRTLTINPKKHLRFQHQATTSTDSLDGEDSCAKTEVAGGEYLSLFVLAADVQRMRMVSTLLF